MNVLSIIRTLLSEHGQLACPAAIAIMVGVEFHTVVADQAAKDGHRRADLAASCGHIGATARDDGAFDTCVRPDGVLVSASSTR